MANLHAVAVPATATSRRIKLTLIPDTAPPFVRDVTATILALRGDTLPVSALPVDGTYPTGTARYEKRNIADQVPVWESDLCIQCGQCAIVCPHSVIRSKYYDESRLAGAPAAFKAAPINARGYPDSRFTLQVYVEDCTGCGVCVENCPAHSPDDVAVKAINMKDRLQHLEAGRESIGFFETLPWADRTRVNFANVRGVQFLEPLFEFSGACAGCGETPYLKLLSQLFGDRLQIANATGCSSIYGANLPTTPWAANADGRGPAWANSLFEDNAEFGLGYRLAIDSQRGQARTLAEKLAPRIGADLVAAILDGAAADRVGLPRAAGARRRAEGRTRGRDAIRRRPTCWRSRTSCMRRSVWIVGGDGWAYDIDYGGLDHVLATGKDVNILVLDTEVYSNTGGQASKATPLGASAKFASAGKTSPRKDLAMMAIAYGNVYVAQIAMGANNEQALVAMREAEAYRGTSIILAYSQCIAHGTDLRHGMKQAARAVASGYWPLFRFDPTMRRSGHEPVPAGLAAAAHSAGGVPVQRSALQVADADAPGLRQADAGAGAARPRGALPHVRGSGLARRQPVPAALAGQLVMTLATRYLGLTLAHPIVASASPLTSTVDGMRRLEDAGAAAVVMASLFEEQIRAEDTAYALLTEHGSNSQAEASNYFPELADYNAGVSGHLETVRRASEALDIPVIASLNGTTAEGWIEHARNLEQAGARAIELNVYSVPIDAAVSGAEVERRTVDIVREVRSSVQIPISIKLAPYFTSLPHLAADLVRAGAGRPGALQPLLRAGHRSDDAADDAVAAALDQGRTAAVAGLDWIALAARRVLARGEPRRRDRGRSGEVPARRRGRRHDDVRAAAARAAASRRDAGRPRALARREPVRLGRGHSRIEGRLARRGRGRVSARPVRGRRSRTTCQASWCSRPDAAGQASRSGRFLLTVNTDACHGVASTYNPRF